MQYIPPDLRQWRHVEMPELGVSMICDIMFCGNEHIINTPDYDIREHLCIKHVEHNTLADGSIFFATIVVH